MSPQGRAGASSSTLDAGSLTVHAYRDAVLSAAGPADPATRLVCLAIAKYVNARTLMTFVSQRRIAEVTALSERSVRTHVTRAADAGWLECTRKNRGKDWTLTNYRIAIPPSHAPAEIAAASVTAIDGPANGAHAPAILAGGAANGAHAPAKKRTDDRQYLPPISKEGSRDITRTGTRSELGACFSSGETEERIRTALRNWPDYSDEQLAKLLKVRASAIRDVRSSSGASAS